VQLTPVQPYDFNLLLSVLRRYPEQSVFQVQAEDAAYYRMLQYGTDDRDYVLVRVTPDDSYTLQVDALAHTGDTPPDENALLQSVRHVLGADADLRDFYQFAKTQPDLWRVIAPVHGLPLFRTETLYEALIFMIIEQHISWVAANRAQRWLVETYGVALTHGERTLYAMPAPQTLANLTVDDLKPMKITFRRMQQLIDLSRRIADGDINTGALLQNTPQAMYDDLLTLKGVGHWTAAGVVHRARGVYPYVLHTDVALQRAAAHYFDVEKDASVTRDLFRQYGAYAGLAAHLTLMRYVLDFYDPPTG
jgi:DNA-3-methyladenine glycosylase II